MCESPGRRPEKTTLAVLYHTHLHACDACMAKEELCVYTLAWVCMWTGSVLWAEFVQLWVYPVVTPGPWNMVIPGPWNKKCSVWWCKGVLW